ncbi:MAG: hypothetical protein LBJ01_11600 [Tannerella sp.]|nr:hypothetical protein [Tannerella sp.]
METVNTLLLSLIFAINMQSQTLAYAESNAIPTCTNPDGGKKSENNKTETVRFTYEVYGEIPVKETVFEETHYLGSEITDKWNTFRISYTQEYEISVGLSSSVVEIRKPAVYNSVIKVDKYLKKAIRKNEISEEDVRKRFAHMLDCANVICTENNTTDLERVVAAIKEPMAILEFFDKIVLVTL